MRKVLFASAILTLTIAAQAAERVPSFPRKTGYPEARISLLALGWQPVHSADADVCDQEDERCKGRPEMLACSGTGLARCTFLWKKSDTLIELGTFGEIDPITVDAVRCRAGCR